MLLQGLCRTTYIDISHIHLFNNYTITENLLSWTISHMAQKTFSRAWEMVQWVKPLLHPCEYLNSNPRIHIKLDVALHICSLNTDGSWRHKYPYKLWASQPDICFSNLQGTLSHTRCKVRTDSWGCPVTCTFMLWHTSAHIHTQKVERKRLFILSTR